jgi:hypothetical protein
MSKIAKFWRTARDLVRQFEVEYAVDPEKAKENFEARLQNERGITQRYARAILKRRFPGEDHG